MMIVDAAGNVVWVYAGSEEQHPRRYVPMTQCAPCFFQRYPQAPLSKLGLVCVVLAQSVPMYSIRMRCRCQSQGTLASFSQYRRCSEVR